MDRARWLLGRSYQCTDKNAIDLVLIEYWVEILEMFPLCHDGKWYTGMLLVTHDKHLASCANRIVTLEKGILVELIVR